MAIIVLQELDKQMPPDFGPGAAASFIAAVHAAPADPDVPGDPDDRTLCGRPTLGMEPVPYEPAGPGAPWLPPKLRRWECPDCAAALRT
ncbi:hypothetical protein ACFUG9_34270 [Streptomyces griseoincarnatus]